MKINNKEEYSSKSYSELLQIAKLRGVLKGFKGKDFKKDNIIKCLLKQDSLFEKKSSATKLESKVAKIDSNKIVKKIKTKLSEIDNLLKQL